VIPTRGEVLPDGRSLSLASLYHGSAEDKKTVTISSCTAEYVAITEAMKQVLFLRNLTKFLRMDIVPPLRVLCDNMGVVFLSNNFEGKRTKYLETQYHFVREYVQKKTVTVKFIHTDENYADIFTKNVVPEVHRELTDYMCLLCATASVTESRWGVETDEKSASEPSLIN